MKKTFLIAGSGGQGVQTLGMLMAIAATEARYKATYLPAYGGEMRGGTSNCTTTISDCFIGAPNAATYDTVVTLNAPSYAKFASKVKEGGTLIYNSSLITEPVSADNNTVYSLDLGNLVEEVGNPLSLNAILYGFLTGFIGIPTEIAKAVLEEKLGKNGKFVAINNKAFELGLAKFNELGDTV